MQHIVRSVRGSASNISYVFVTSSLPPRMILSSWIGSLALKVEWRHLIRGGNSPYFLLSLSIYFYICMCPFGWRIFLAHLGERSRFFNLVYRTFIERFFIIWIILFLTSWFRGLSDKFNFTERDNNMRFRSPLGTDTRYIYRPFSFVY